MDVANQPVTQNGSNSGFRFRFKKVKECGHRIAHGFPTGRHVTGCAQENEFVSIAGESGGGEKYPGGGGGGGGALTTPLGGKGGRDRSVFGGAFFLRPGLQ